MDRQLQEAIERVVKRGRVAVEGWLAVATLESRDYMADDHLGVIRMLSGIRQTASAYDASRMDDHRAYDAE